MRSFYLLEIQGLNEKFCFSTTDKKFEIDDQQYLPGCKINDVVIENIASSNSFEVKIISKTLKNDEIVGGRVKIYFVSNDKENIKTLIFYGIVDKVFIEKKNEIILRLVSIVEQLQKPSGNLFSPICRISFGCKKCGLNIENYKSSGEIVEIVSQDCFVGNHTATAFAEYFSYGTIKFLTGKLTGFTAQIKNEDSGKVFLLLNLKGLKVGDKYEIYAGCNKTTACCKKFNNIANFRGEPFINND